MPGHDIIVIGASAGGLKALGAIVGSLPTEIDAAIFIVQHLPADKPSILPKILADVGSLPGISPVRRRANSKRANLRRAPRLSPVAQ